MHRFVFALMFLPLGSLAFPVTTALATGARSFKSGPIQITADGAWVWVVNPDSDSVSRLETATDKAVEFPLPDPATRDNPLGLSVREDGSEVWVACHDSDRLYVLRGSDGSLLRQIDLPWGSGPHSLALSRDQSRVLVTLHRAAAIAMINANTKNLSKILAPTYWSPLGIAWMEDGVNAWVTHLFADGEDPFMSRVDVSGPEPKVMSQLIVKSTNPKQSGALTDPNPARNLAEGGYLTFRGHPAQVPTTSGRSEVWLPTQYNNINENIYTPDTTVQTTMRHLNLTNHVIGNTNNDKVILTAVHVHDPIAAGNPWVGAGWDARISGPVDIGFSADGLTAYVLNEQSNDLLVLATNTPAIRTTGFSLVEIPVGWRPMGMALSPTSDRVYVMNQLGRSISVVDLVTQVEIRQIPVTTEPFPAPILNGAKLFHSSVDPAGLGRISVNEKIACASCHPHAEHDGRIWDFENLPGNHGPRSTMSLLGLAETLGPPDPTTGWGQLHRSGDRDEIEDFEHTFQGVSMGGGGVLGGSACLELDPTCLNAAQPGGQDLNDLAAYLLSLPAIPRSPYRRGDGGLSDAAVRGATFFTGGNYPARPADADCASCHVPETGWVDFKFHDVGQRRPAAENELNNRTPAWHVNTPTLRGVWTSPPYDGVAMYASSLVGVVKDLAGRATHGTPGRLTGRQKADLAAFVGSIDGNLTAAEVRAARDTTPPRMIRVEPISTTQIVVWFDETVEPTSAQNPANFTLIDLTAAAPVAITAALWDPQNGDRVTLTTAMQVGCPAIRYQLSPTPGSLGVTDAAGSASNGNNNPIVAADPANLHQFLLTNPLVVTLGASGYESLTVPTHDAAMVGQNLSGWGHDSPWLYMNANWGLNKGFVRWDWESAFATATGLTNPTDIVDASFSLMPAWGDAQDIAIRRTLLSWSDSPTGGDWNSNPTGAPTWTSHAHGSGAWNQAGARRTAVGVDGRNVADYNGGNDVANQLDATVSMPAINERTVFSGAMVTDAFRFWYANRGVTPRVDWGYALELANNNAGLFPEAKYDNWESGLGEAGPVLTITYNLPGPPVQQPGEVSGRGTQRPLWMTKTSGTPILLSFDDIGAPATSYNLYEGTIGSYYSHAGAACGVTPLVVGPRRETLHTPTAGSRYFIVTGTNACAEGPSDLAHPPALLDCLP